MAVRTFLPYTKIVKNPCVKQKIPNPQKLGEHLLNKRLERGLLQREVAVLLAVSEDTVTYWENGRTEPQVQHYPAIFSFLAYYPFACDQNDFREMLTKVRYCNGWDYRELGSALAVDGSTVQRWIKTQCTVPKKKMQRIADLVEQFVAQHDLSY